MRIDQRNKAIDTIILNLFSDPETLMDVDEIFSSIRQMMLESLVIKK